MARYIGPVCRLCRREGVKLFLKGDRCYTEKCGLTMRAQAPGQHGSGRKKLSEYGMQLREKQKVRRYYGVLEKQFEGYFNMANKRQGITGENLLQILESRLDNVVYRLGFAHSRAQARQIVRHNHILVDGKRVNIPSFLVKAGNVVSICKKSTEKNMIKDILEATSSKVIPPWLELDRAAVSAKVIHLADRQDIDLDISETLIVELYSK